MIYRGLFWFFIYPYSFSSGTVDLYAIRADVPSAAFGVRPIDLPRVQVLFRSETQG
jgi:hypothetical protein